MPEYYEKIRESSTLCYFFMALTRCCNTIHVSNISTNSGFNTFVSIHICLSLFELNASEKEKENCKVYIKTSKGLEIKECDIVLSAVGIEANIEGIGFVEVPGSRLTYYWTADFR